MASHIKLSKRANVMYIHIIFVYHIVLIGVLGIVGSFVCRIGQLLILIEAPKMMVYYLHINILLNKEK